MRLVAINQSLWLDEAIGALVVRDQSYAQIITEFPKNDNHPPLYYLSLKLWSEIFGYSEFALRSLSVLFGVVTVFLIYKIALLIGGVGNKKRFQLAKISLLLLATSPFHIYYSQEARMYSMAAFLASFSIYCFLRVTKDSNYVRYWVLFSLSITALVFTDYVPFFLLPAFWILGILKNKDKLWWRNFILSHLPLALMGFVWLPTLMQQVERGRWLLKTLPAWRQVAGGATLKQAILVWMKFVLGRISLKNKLFYYLLVIIASIPFTFAILKSWRTKKKAETEILWLWLFIPLFLGFTVSFLFPAFIYFRFLYIIPAFCLVVSWGLVNIKLSFFQQVFTILLIVINFLGWYIYISEPYQQRERWREAVQLIESLAKAQDIVIFEFPEPFAPYRWYEGGIVESMGVTDSISANRNKTINKTKKAIKQKSGIYYFEYLRDLSDPNRYVEKAISEEEFKPIYVYDYFPGVGQITYYLRQ